MLEPADKQVCRSCAGRDRRTAGNRASTRVQSAAVRTEEAVAEGAPGVELTLQALDVDQEVNEVTVRVVSARGNSSCGAAQ